MERQSRGTDRDSKSRRIPYRITKELGASYKVNGRSVEEYEEAV